MTKDFVDLPTMLMDYRPQHFSLERAELSQDEFEILAENIRILRDTIVFVTALSGAKGLGGHTGGPYDIVPELLIAEGFINGGVPINPTPFDEAGHRVAIHYVLSALRGHLPIEALLHYREANWRLPGHPERGLTPGIDFSSGRLGHLWSFVNGVARRNPEQAVCLFGSDGSQQEGNNAEAARLAVQHGLNVKLIIDDNDITIAGHPSHYLGSFDLGRTLAGHGIPTVSVDGQDWRELYRVLRDVFANQGPHAVLVKRKIAIGIPNIEGKPAAHDVVKPADAIQYFSDRGNERARDLIAEAKAPPGAEEYFFSSNLKKTHRVRDAFGLLACECLAEYEAGSLPKKVVVVDSDLEGSCGLHHIHKAFPQIYISAGVMERANFSLAAGFGSQPDAQGVFGTFSAFSEMVISEMTMARLNQANVLCHFSHAGVDDVADNTCHFGINNLIMDSGIGEYDTTQLYFPADEFQLGPLLRSIFREPGIRIVMSTRSAVPPILGEDGQPFFGEGYRFRPGKDDIIREGRAGWIVSYGDILHRCLDAVDRLRLDGFDVGLVNKPHLNVMDEPTLAKIGASPFVFVFESQNRKTGLGRLLGTALLERGFHPRYMHFGVTKEGIGGLWEQIVHQGLDSKSIYRQVRAALDGDGDERRELGGHVEQDAPGSSI